MRFIPFSFSLSAILVSFSLSTSFALVPFHSQLSPTCHQDFAWSCSLYVLLTIFHFLFSLFQAFMISFSLELSLSHSFDFFRPLPHVLFLLQFIWISSLLISSSLSMKFFNSLWEVIFLQWAWLVTKRNHEVVNYTRSLLKINPNLPIWWKYLELRGIMVNMGRIHRELGKFLMISLNLIKSDDESMIEIGKNGILWKRTSRQFNKIKNRRIWLWFCGEIEDRSEVIFLKS